MSKDDELLFHIFGPGTGEVSLHCSALGRTGNQSGARSLFALLSTPTEHVFSRKLSSPGLWASLGHKGEKYRSFSS